MAVDIAKFRADFPEFADTTAYPDPQVTFYLGLAGKLLNVARWVDLIDYGTELFVAHNLALERQAQTTAAKGGTPGMQQGALSGKTVGPVSATYDTSAGLELDGGHWNLTVYGTRFLRLVRMAGAGGVQR